MNQLTDLERAERLGPDLVAARADVLSLVARPLEDVEAMFRGSLASPIRIVGEIGEFVAAGGGKRIRPTLHLLCAQLCGYRGPHGVVLATVLELIHCATLIHDDIIDGATTRRGRASVNARWGNDVTVLFGDYMFAKAMQLALQAGSLRIMEKLAEVTLRMTEGEMLQTRYAGRIDLTVEEYLDLVEKKTAALFACCGELAGILVAVDGETEAALHDYGLNLGLAFQIVDDLLDLTGDAERLGKPAARDLREGKPTLAVLDLLATGSTEARRLVQKVMEDGTGEGTEILALTAMLHESGAIERARERARTHAARAAAALGRFEQGPARSALQSLPALLLHRDR